MTADQKTAVRDFVLARLAVCDAMLANARETLQGIVNHFVDPDDDPDGATRKELLASADDWIGEAARAVQAAQELAVDIDPQEGEPDLPEGDGHDEDDDEDDDDLN